MDIGPEQRPYVLEPVADPVPAEVPAWEESPAPAEQPEGIPAEVGA